MCLCPVLAQLLKKTFVNTVNAVNNMNTNGNTIFCLLEMPRPETAPGPVPEDEPLSTDPANWPSVLTDRIRTQLVCRGPSEVPADFVFPRNEVDGRSCHHQYFKKTLVNGEKTCHHQHQSYSCTTDFV